MTTVTPVRHEPGQRRRRHAASTGTLDELELRTRVREILSRRPAVGFALGVIRDGRLAFFHGHGLADVASNTPVTEDTVFRIASLTKLITAVAVMQLVERGLVDLDAPVDDILRAYPLIPAKPGFRPVTLRHLLTHTSGIPDVLHVTDLLHPGWGRFEDRPASHSVQVGEPMPSLAELYRGGLPIVVEPGTAFAYSNHGVATLGQVIEDVTRTPLDRHYREHIFEPLGMTETDLLRSKRVSSRLATGYDLTSGGATPVPDREWATPAASSISSTTRDMARFAAALLGGGANEHGSVLARGTLSTMFDPQFQPDPRLPGMGLGFFRSDVGGHRVVGHDGRMPGFHAQLLVAPDDGIGVIGMTNGSSGAISWLPTELERLLGHLVGASETVIRTDLPHHPEVWGEICGRYRLPERVSDLRGRLTMGGGVEVFVRDGRLMARLRAPVPALFRGLPLHPDDENDPYAFRLDLSSFAMPLARVVFSREVGAGVTGLHSDLGMLTFTRPPGPEGRSAWLPRAAAALLVGTTAVAVGRRLARDRR